MTTNFGERARLQILELEQQVTDLKGEWSYQRVELLSQLLGGSYEDNGELRRELQEAWLIISELRKELATAAYVAAEDNLVGGKVPSASKSIPKIPDSPTTRHAKEHKP